VGSEVSREKGWCRGVCLTGPWRGWRCGKKSKHLGPDGKRYCSAHIEIARNQPERFKKAKADKAKADRAERERWRR